MIDRRTIIKQATASLAVAGSARSVAGAHRERPNILWIVSEDNNPFIGAYGDSHARTPNIDELAKRGILYLNAFSNAPVCAPSRFGILTGVYPESCSPAQHMRANAHIAGILPTYPELLRKAGYYVTNNVKTDYNCDVDPGKIWDESSTKAHWKNSPAGKPFMSVFNLMTTHELQNFKPNPGAVKPEDVRVPAYLPDVPAIRQDIAGYYTQMERMDGQVGRILAELEEGGRADDTIVFYYSDNGGVLPRSKRYCRDSGLRCALVVYVPPKWAHIVNAKPGSEIRDPASLIDLAPTILSLAGEDIPKVMQGKPLLGLHRSPTSSYSFGMRNRMDERYDFVRTVSDGRFRYVRNYMPHLPLIQHQAFAWLAKGYQALDRLRIDGRLTKAQQAMFEPRTYEELYDTVSDQDEVNNLVESSAHQAKLGELRKTLDAHMLAINDNGFIPEGSRHEGYVASRIRGAYPLKRLMALGQAAARGDPRKVGTFRAALRDPNEVVRFWAVTGFAIQGVTGPDLDQVRDIGLHDPVPQVRVAAAEALARSGFANEACPVLISLIEQELSRTVSLQALNVLTRMGEGARPALPVVRQLASSKDEYIPNAALFLEQLLDGSYDPAKPVFDLEAMLGRGSTNSPNPKN